MRPMERRAARGAAAIISDAAVFVIRCRILDALPWGASIDVHDGRFRRCQLEGKRICLIRKEPGLERLLMQKRRHPPRRHLSRPSSSAREPARQRMRKSSGRKERKFPIETSASGSRPTSSGSKKVNQRVAQRRIGIWRKNGSSRKTTGAKRPNALPQASTP